MKAQRRELQRDAPRNTGSPFSLFQSLPHSHGINSRKLIILPGAERERERGGGGEGGRDLERERDQEKERGRLDGEMVCTKTAEQQHCA